MDPQRLALLQLERNLIAGVCRGVELEPCLWNPLDSNYRNYTAKSLASRRIAQQINRTVFRRLPQHCITGADAKLLWEGYRSTWMRYQNRIIGGDFGLGARVATPALFKLRGTHFLLNYSLHANGQNNVDIRSRLDNMIRSRLREARR
ncbi:hypothetical protein QAD02_014197 [Eretmocerus hayati]|uniref:Uncharacterized protein n=1 Tax=Eretmocerus hayati TaxID=131215 RepID=A0ACC2P4U0_9HYME|nr:hypothetical protein QAD02_014197 [Eretmocerus hayati]